MTYSKNPWTYRDVSDHARMVSWFQAMETGIASGGGSSFPASALRAYADYANGLDSNDGLGPASAKKTIQAAYNTLQTTALATYNTDSNGRLGIGTIICLPGDHEVGAGLQFDARYAVELRGTRAGRRNHDMKNSATRLVSSSAAGTELVSVTRASTIGMGFVFRNLAFVPNAAVNTALTRLLYLHTVDHAFVEDCSFDTSDNVASIDIPAILQEDIGSGGDSAWMRISRCNSNGMQFYKASTTDGSHAANYNNLVIRDCVCFYSGTLAMVEISGSFHGITVEDNWMEGSATAVKVGTSPSSFSAFFKNNAGQDSAGGTPTYPFYDLENTSEGTFIIGGACTTPFASGAGTWAKFGGSFSRGVVVGSDFGRGATRTDVKCKISDSSSAGVVVLDSETGVVQKVVTAAGKTNGADADFGYPPDDGTWYLIKNSSDSTVRLTARVGGAWKAVQLT